MFEYCNIWDDCIFSCDVQNECVKCKISKIQDNWVFPILNYLELVQLDSKKKFKIKNDFCEIWNLFSHNLRKTQVFGMVWVTLLENHVYNFENEHVKVNLYGFGVNCHGLLAIINKYGIVISRWAWFCQALSEMSKKTMWIICADDWTVE